MNILKKHKLGSILNKKKYDSTPKTHHGSVKKYINNNTLNRNK